MPRTTRKKSGPPSALERLTESARRGELVAVIGTGLSLALTDGKVRALSWKGLIKDGLEYGKTKGKITRTR